MIRAGAKTTRCILPRSEASDGDPPVRDSTDAGITSPGELVGAVMCAASGWQWAAAGYGRRWLVLFDRALLILETDLRGRPLGLKSLLADGDAATAEFLPAYARALEALDPRNAFVPVDDIEAARLSGRRRRSLLCLELQTRGGRDFSAYWRASLTYKKLPVDGAVPKPKLMIDVARADLRSVLGGILDDRTQ
jgi:hypothetical protein